MPHQLGCTPSNPAGGRGHRRRAAAGALHCLRAAPGGLCGVLIYIWYTCTAEGASAATAHRGSILAMQGRNCPLVTQCRCCTPWCTCTTRGASTATSRQPTSCWPRMAGSRCRTLACRRSSGGCCIYGAVGSSRAVESQNLSTWAGQQALACWRSSGALPGCACCARVVSGLFAVLMCLDVHLPVGTRLGLQLSGRCGLLLTPAIPDYPSAVALWATSGARLWAARSGWCAVLCLLLR